MSYSILSYVLGSLLYCVPCCHKQGEVYIRGQKRDGLISDEELSGLRIGLVNFLFPCMLYALCWQSFWCVCYTENAIFNAYISYLTGVSECCTFWFVDCSWKCWFPSVRSFRFFWILAFFCIVFHLVQMTYCSGINKYAAVELILLFN